MSMLTNLQIIWNSYHSQLKAHKASPTIARETAAVREAAASIKTVDDFIKNKPVFDYVLKAYGMDDKPYPAFIKKLLVEGTKDEKAFVHGFVDPRYKEFVKDMGFGEGGDGSFDSYYFVEKLIRKYETVTFEEKKGEIDVNLQLAMYFDRKAPEIDNWFQVLGDKAMSEVVFTAMGMPPEARLGNIDKLAETLERRMPIGDFKDPAKVKSVLQRFAIFADKPNVIANSPILNLMQGATGPRQIVNIDPAMLAEANRMRFL